VPKIPSPTPSPARRRWLRLLGTGALGGVAITARVSRAQTPGLIAAASDLQFALEELLTLAERQGLPRARVSFGSSGNLSRQIAQGAPFELFLSADETYVHRLHEAGLTVDAGRLYALGRLVLYQSRAAPTPAADVALREAIGSPAVRRFAIANPEHAPYGRAARQALERLGLWDAVQPRLVIGENVSQAAQFVASGAAQAGLVALSVAQAPAFAAAGHHRLVPEALHEPLRQRMVLMRGASAGARQLFAFLGGPAAREVLARHGFGAPPPEAR
jgi:molybdate transport system substrate-binding protein